MSDNHCCNNEKILIQNGLQFCSCYLLVMRSWTHNISAILFTDGDQGYTKVQKHVGLLCPFNEWTVPHTTRKYSILSLVIFLSLKSILSNINIGTTILFLLLFSVYMIHLFLSIYFLFVCLKECLLQIYYVPGRKYSKLFKSFSR